MTDDQLRELLEQILKLALRGFPSPGEEHNDKTLGWALCRIAGIAFAALTPDAS